MKILKTLTLEEMKMLRRLGSERITKGLLLPQILQDCTDLSIHDIFRLSEEEVISAFNQLFEESLKSYSV